MQTQQKPSDLINQAITNLFGIADSELILKLWECMKAASAIEIKQELKDQANGPAGAWCESFLKHPNFGFGCGINTDWITTGPINPVADLKKNVSHFAEMGYKAGDFHKKQVDKIIDAENNPAKMALDFIYKYPFDYNKKPQLFELVCLFCIDTLPKTANNKELINLYYAVCKELGHDSPPKPVELEVTLSPYKRNIKFEKFSTLDEALKNGETKTVVNVFAEDKKESIYRFGFPKIGMHSGPPHEMFPSPRYGKEHATAEFLIEHSDAAIFIQRNLDEADSIEIGKNLIKTFADLSDKKPHKPTIRVNVIHGNGSVWKWYNELVGDEIVADFISADGKAFFSNIHAKKAPGYIPKGSFELVTEGAKCFTVKIIKKQFHTLWYNVGETHAVAPKSQTSSYLVIDAFKYAFAIFKTDCIITGAEYGN